MRKILTIVLCSLSALMMQAQVRIGGSVYGGGNAGDTGGSTTVTVRAGDLNCVFGGARMANIEGSAFVNIDGEHASNYILINRVYGGNDISGEIGTSDNLPTPVASNTDGVNNTWNAFVHISAKNISTYTAEEAAAYNTAHQLEEGQAGYVSEGDVKEDSNQPIYIGQLFGGGNGEYYYYNNVTDGKHYIYQSEKDFTDGKAPIASNETGFNLPNIDKTYVDVHGGSIVYAYGGGNNATVTESTVICVDNPTAVVNTIIDPTNPKADDDGELLTNARFKEMGINTSLSYPGSDEYQIGRFFGGNNQEVMAIRPTWHLQSGKIRNLYSGGNRGDMTSEVGLLLEIPKTSTIVVDNLFGGCRMANVDPKDENGNPVEVTNAALNKAFGYMTEAEYQYHFPDKLSARVLVRGGDIHNVYGGNDITGSVKGGNAVGIYTSISGDVYGGGNGSYPYTDNDKLKDNDIYGDLYYGDFMTEKGYTSSVEALNAFRPNAEAVSLRVAGNAITQQNGENLEVTSINPTIIGGAIYVGGNSASLKKKEGEENPMVELKIGSYVIADNVFLGNNGYNMVQNKNPRDVLSVMSGNAIDENNAEIKDAGNNPIDFSSINLTNSATFAAYMDGCAMDIRPSVVFDDATRGDPATYEDYSTYFGSIYCGGNVGSMTDPDQTTIDFKRKIVVFDKVVGGCNNAYVPAKSNVNAEYIGGIIGSTSERAENGFNDKKGNIRNRLVINFNGLKIQPKRWRITEGTYQDDAPTADDARPENYPNQYLIWNTVDGAGNPTSPVTSMVTSSSSYDSQTGTITSSDADKERRFKGGNIYGGCYQSGVVNGNVVINLNNSIIDRDILFDEVAEDEEGEAILYGHDNFTIKERRTGVILDEQGMDVLGGALNVFGGGKGAGTEIWGSTTINLNAGYTFQLFGGSEEGVIGRPKANGSYPFSYKIDDGTTDGVTINKAYSYDPKYSCYVNLRGANAGVSKQADHSEAMAECEFMYGGGFFGPIIGNTVINLGKGRIFNSFAGSCNADILGHTETYIGRHVKKDYENNMSANAASEDTYEGGFPWIRDKIYGGNDLGGRILGEKDFSSRVNINTLSMVHGYDKTSNPAPDVVKASAYLEYLQGRVDAIFGGCYGTYDYTEDRFTSRGYTNPDGSEREGFYKPFLNNAFVNFRPTYYDDKNVCKKVYGAGQGQSGESARDLLQNRSYVLIDIPQTVQFNKFGNMEVFGAGEWGGIGMGVNPNDLVDHQETQGENTVTVKGNPDKASAIIDLVRGNISAAYGASYKEGFTRRTVVNVPDGATIIINKIFGGGYGIDEDGYRNVKPCDAYEAQVNYNSDLANVTSAIYGGNNNYRRTLYAQVNIRKPVYNGDTDLNEQPMTATIYGAGYGVGTWAQYTEVNLLPGAEVYEVYGGGQMGRVMNKKSVDAWASEANAQATSDYNTAHTAWVNLPEEDKATTPEPQEPQDIDLTMGGYADDGLRNVLVHANRDGSKHNTNVHINKDAIVNMYYVQKPKGPGYSGGYAYGGGLGDSTDGTGDVYGTTYIDLLGGTVKKDLYAAGTSGCVMNEYNITKDDFGEDFIASANAYIEGGVARNVYGGGWEGTVGKHVGNITTAWSGDILGETNVVIGKLDGTGYYDGIPAIERNAYGGGEGGPVYGTAHLTLKNGYIGYVYNKDGTDDPETDIDEHYEEKIDDETSDVAGTLFDSGCIFGGGYIDNSSVDVTDVKMYGGYIRNSLFGGGEIAAIGRGTADETEDENGVANKIRKLTGIYKAGATNVSLYDGHVLRHVFGGGRGYDNLGGHGHLYSDGYVFGKTGVNIYGGEVGTEEGMANGYGNVFGGGDVGYVYGAIMENDGLYVGIKDGERYDDEWEGYYYKYKIGEDTPYTPSTTTPAATDTNWVTDPVTGEYILTEDCKVLIEPHCRAKVDVTINGHSYSAGDYVPTEDLHHLGNKSADASTWANLDDKGIIIHNAVFAGGNVTSGSDQLYAEAKTVLGNATASIHDVYHRDLITIGTGHTGGLYGDGNLTFVDGYRGLNITNYGTDYYNISTEIDIITYRTLPAREQAYYELKYSCLQECTDNEGKTYYPADPSKNRKASTITADEFLVRFEGQTPGASDPWMIGEDGKPNPAYWEEAGVCSRYAGRIMNTIQRADFCGVFGSRMVMQGAKDRVVDQNDKTNYTINRVREVSLNKKHSVISSDKTLKPGGKEEDEDWADMNKAVHGNYFGIYNIVNYLGALTSDVHFKDPDNGNEDKRKTESTSTPADGKTYYQWKEANKNNQTRNNGSSLNKVALASGVYLELTTEKSTGNSIEQKDWGYITGVIELDLINVQTGIGGGFVYAKNEHGKQHYEKLSHSTLTALNAEAVTRKDFTYIETNLQEFETSGNFVHSTQTIIDDCYPESNRYNPSSSDYVKAHYWYIKGQVYVYDQYISAYTGAPNAYSKVEYLNLTIAAASHGEMTLVDVKPNRYAYYSSFNNNSGTKLSAEGELEIGEKIYKLNDPISYWDYNLLSASEKRLFVDKTYVTIATCKIGQTVYPAGYVMLQSEYDDLKTAAGDPRTIDGYDKPVKAVELWGKDENDQDVYLNKDEAFDFVFRESNNMSHNTGYMLTYDVTNPKVWNTWYTPENGTTADKMTKEQYDSAGKPDGYHNGPTYHPTADGIYGQKQYKVSDIIEEETYVIYEGDGTSANKGLRGDHSAAIEALNNTDADGDGVADRKQATFKKAYVVTSTITLGDKHLYKGATLAKEQYTDEQWTTISGSVTDAFVCTSTLKLDDNVVIYVNSVLTQDEINDFKTAYSSLADAIDDVMSPAYYCTAPGYYGGDWYVSNKNYRGLAAWSALSPEDRASFSFNYDAFDVLIDPKYSRNELEKYQYDGLNFTTEEQAKTNPAGYSISQPLDYKATNGGAAFTYTDKDGVSHTVAAGTELDRVEYEVLPNEQHHYARIEVKTAGSYYVVKKGFVRGDTPYAVGQVLSYEEWNSLGDDQSNTTTLTFTSTGNYYYCRESYVIGENGEGKAVTGITGIGAVASGNRAVGQTVEVGLVIEEGDEDAGYKSLTNRQLGFTIHGVAPIETSTLYVSRQSDIYDLSTEKIITVIYQYNYEESDENGMNITPVSERHVINIHIQFESGIPEVENISKPNIVLPGTEITIRTPNVKPGAFEIQGGGWMLFERQSDTESHINGIEFTPSSDPLYWYQDDYWLAYYAKTYLGKTFSNAVQVSVANYHDLADVMSDENKTHHMYIDNPNVKRDPKIYIKSQDGLTNLANLFKLSTGGSVGEHSSVNTDQIGNCANLQFYLQTNIDASSSAWTPIGDNTNCFAGMFHGDGYTISGLTPATGTTGSLFGKLCGKVYNLGVTGSFTGSGIADSGSGDKSRVENCWVKTTGTTTGSKAVFGGTVGTLVNSYYVTGQYSSANTGATAKSVQEFYNGTVAYDLNGFYLNKRYYDNNSAWEGEKKPYDYLASAIDGELPTSLSDGNYPEGYAIYQPQLKVAVGETLPDLGYVENRFYDGDYRYAGGSIPEGVDMRTRTKMVTIGTKTEEKTIFSPIWPDDYLFFGQALNYSHMDGIDVAEERTHQDLPSRIVKSSDRILTTEEGNVIYRAPAYFQSSTMGVAYFNPHAVFAQTKKDDATVIAYKNMTAIDFTGGNGDVAGGYEQGLNGGKFYPPLLDDGGLKDIYIADLTRNLLVYSTKGTQTDDVVKGYLLDEPIVETDDKYRTVNTWDSYSTNVRGHWVQKTDDGYMAQRDHLLVDMQDFNCPISYKFADDKRMWYQRLPERYVTTTKGWDVVSLPFTAELVTTQDKGEITHFYSGSKSIEGSDAKIGHEYWLREFTGGSASGNTFNATFDVPNGAKADKTVTNTFLWDHYYSNAHQLDINKDTYQTFYKADRQYNDYAMLTNDQAYIVGFPGKTFYEFDLSGEWTATYTDLPEPDPVSQQTITFASMPGTTILVSDTEIAKTTAKGRYTFVPNYLNKTLTAGYFMNDDGDKFSVPSSIVAVPFRPYFVAGSISAPAPSTRGIQYIVFDNADSSFAIDDKDPSEGDVSGGLEFSVRRHTIIVTSTLRQEADVRIVNTGGQTIAAFNIQPGETIETPVRSSGVYIIHAAGGHYVKKLSVK
jgi:hypothetical protein